jgi:hypothetical protein
MQKDGCWGAQLCICVLYHVSTMPCEHGKETVHQKWTFINTLFVARDTLADLEINSKNAHDLSKTCYII